MRHSFPPAVALCAALGSASSAFAQSSVTLFGVMDSAIHGVRNGSAGTAYSMVSGSLNSSRFGVKGTEDLGGGLAAGFWLESDIASNTGAGGVNTSTFSSFWSRRSTVSLTSARFGELRMGRDYVPGHVVLCGYYDPFGCNGVGNAKAFDTASAAVSKAFGTGQTSLVRANNGIQYYLPSGLGGVYGNVVVTAPGHGDISTGASNAEAVLVGYARGPVNVTVAYMKTLSTLVPGQSFKDAIVGASYDFRVVKLSATYRKYTFGSDKLATTMVGVIAPIGPAQFVKASYVRADQSSADGYQVALGYVYLFSKSTSVYATVSRLSNKGAAKVVIPGGPSVSNIPGGFTSTGYEVGLSHNF